MQVRLELQEKLDCDLTDRKKEVDSLVMEVIDEQTQVGTIQYFRYYTVLK